jgi:hypothetical protein
MTRQLMRRFTATAGQATAATRTGALGQTNRRAHAMYKAAVTTKLVARADEMLVLQLGSRVEQSKFPDGPVLAQSQLAVR